MSEAQEEFKKWRWHGEASQHQNENDEPTEQDLRNHEHHLDLEELVYRKEHKEDIELGWM